MNDNSTQNNNVSPDNAFDSMAPIDLSREFSGEAPPSHITTQICDTFKDGKKLYDRGKNVVDIIQSIKYRATLCVVFLFLSIIIGLGVSAFNTQWVREHTPATANPANSTQTHETTPATNTTDTANVANVETGAENTDK
ncbi:MAG: hypothetical protein IIY06_06430 [Proteobacteria bacterium]|jgi:hypothetical protein|nr:hypothetical protein [Pseudomonadota bacterium]